MGTELIRFEYGSKLYGTSTVHSDSDQMAIYVEDREAVTGISHAQTEEVKTATPGHRSSAGDTDLVRYPLRHWAALAARGNPTVIMALFAPLSLCHLYTPTIDMIRANSGAFVSHDAGRAFLGYMRNQILALTGARNKKTNRPELVHKYGYDTKFAYHALRLGYQGIELMTRGELSLPMDDSVRANLIAIRNGEIGQDEFLATAHRIGKKLEDAIDQNFVPEHANLPVINRVLHEVYMKEFGHGS